MKHGDLIEMTLRNGFDDEGVICVVTQVDNRFLLTDEQGNIIATIRQLWQSPLTGSSDSDKGGCSAPQNKNKECVNASLITVLNSGGYDGWMDGAQFPFDITDAAEVERCHTTYGDLVKIPPEVLEKYGYDLKMGLDHHDYDRKDMGLFFRLKQVGCYEVEAEIHK